VLRSASTRPNQGGYRVCATLIASFLLAATAKTGVAAACLGVDTQGKYSATEHIRCLREQSDQGDFLAQHQLGLIYYDGVDVPRDYEEALKWFRRAADQGHPGAQFMLGSMYVAGYGVQEDLIRAYMWANLSSAQGYEPAIAARDILEKRMTPAQIAEAQKLAREWKPKVAR
jgi:uncharacterized protein